ncbi:MAG: DUF1819 domain-containing protein [Fuerstiella sp.]
MDRPAEVVDYHTRLLKSPIEVEHARAYWRHVDVDACSDNSAAAFSEYWFGARSMPRVEVLLAGFREQFDAYPPSLRVLHCWSNMDSGTRRIICHWHLQLSDQLYREFTGEYLVDRMNHGRTDVTRDLVVRWIEEIAPERWGTSTRIQFARRLLFSATESGLLKGSRDPRQLHIPRVTDEALTYLMYLLREVQIQGSLIDNPYLTSIGLTGRELERRLRALPALLFKKQGDLLEFGWQFDGLYEWASANVLNHEQQLRGTA